VLPGGARSAKCGRVGRWLKEEERKREKKGGKIKGRKGKRGKENSKRKIGNERKRKGLEI
jgi:hypothetical protein